MALPAKLKRLLKSSPATSELAAYLESDGVETPTEPTVETPTEDDNTDAGTDGEGTPYRRCIHQLYRLLSSVLCTIM